MTALLLFVLLLIVLIGACGEFHWLRQTVRERADRLTAELHTVEAIQSEHREILDCLDDGLADLHKILEKQDVSWGYTHKALAEFTKPYAEIAGTLTRLEALLKESALPSNASDLDARLSKSMEEGIMNLMQYAAGKTSGGVEVGLG